MPRTNSDIAKLRAQLQDISERLAALGDDASDDLHDSAASFAAKGADMMKEKWEEARKFTEKTGKKVQDYAEENPWQMLGIGAVVGFLLAQFMKHGDHEEE